MKIVYNILLIIPSIIFSQVGINTNTPNASLEIVSNSTDTESVGLLIPTVKKFTSEKLDEKQNGMLVFLDNDSQDENESKTFSGLYWWDSENSSWQYIFQTKMLESNLFKTIVKSNILKEINEGNTYNGIWYKTDFNFIEAPNANFFISNGDLVIGKTGLYSIFFTGQIDKVKESRPTAPQTEIGMFLNNATVPFIISTSPIPASDQGNRSTNHTISLIKQFEKGDVISVKTKRSVSSTLLKHSSNYTLTLSSLD